MVNDSQVLILLLSLLNALTFYVGVHNYFGSIFDSLCLIAAKLRVNVRLCIKARLKIKAIHTCAHHPNKCQNLLALERDTGGLSERCRWERIITVTEVTVLFSSFKVGSSRLPILWTK